MSKKPLITEIPGIKDVYVIVRQACRQRPQEDWLKDAIDRVRKSLITMDENWPKDRDVQFHVVVTCDSPRTR